MDTNDGRGEITGIVQEITGLTVQPVVILQ